ncbi:MAG: DNA polymerase III subunit gamma/tau [Defluviitaleaceae bacterium]|nr:DNA polymerase III subunit gamma/tau [Defluviitaleaceae bacterium]
MQALYRKIRPRTFGAIVGQAHIVRTLINQLKARQVSHAYLFCGTRGTGKTSAAKIFARAINCFAPVDGEPCNTCEMCENILAERSLDVAEIDAASNNGVDNIRDLREEVKFLPTQGQFKVYIIDEVHMLSGGAFNALLKTLEEPPAHVIFILATTDPQKIPATILSRCQRFDFRRISAADMTAALGDYLRGENLPFDDAALDYIAYHSDGAMRDAISLLDQCLGDDGGLTLEKVRETLGAVDRARLFEFTDALAARDAGVIIGIISDAMNDGRDVSQFAGDLVRHFRDVLVAGLTGGDEFSEDFAAKLKAQAAKIPRNSLMLFIEAFSETLREMRFAPHMRTAFEICALRLCEGRGTAQPVAQSAPSPQPTGSSGSHVSNANVAPVTDSSPVTRQISENSSASGATISPASDSSPAPKKNSPGDFSQISANWSKFCAKLPANIRSFCAPCGTEDVNGMLKIYCGNETAKKIIESKQTIIRENLAEFFKLSTPPNLAVEVNEAYNKPREEAKPPDAPPVDWANFGQEAIDETPW